MQQRVGDDDDVLARAAAQQAAEGRLDVVDGVVDGRVDPVRAACGAASGSSATTASDVTLAERLGYPGAVESERVGA
jgi:hypothetical protein